MPEKDCNTKGFQFLVRNFPKDAVVLPPSERGQKEGEQMAEQMLGLAMTFGNRPGGIASAPPSANKPGINTATEESPDAETLPYNVTENDLFPCLMMCAGSGGSFTVVSCA